MNVPACLCTCTTTVIIHNCMVYWISNLLCGSVSFVKDMRVVFHVNKGGVFMPVFAELVLSL